MELLALTNQNFEFFESIFIPGGSGCYCAVWRTYDETWENRCADPAKPNLTIAKKCIGEGAHWGFLAFENADFVGWTASGPKTEFPLLQSKLGSRMTPFVPTIWSIGCITFRKLEGNEGSSSEIIQAVASKAREARAEFLEAYPTDPWDQPRSYRGNFQQFAQLGFEEAFSEQDEGSRILCMRLKL